MDETPEGARPDWRLFDRRVERLLHDFFSGRRSGSGSGGPIDAWQQSVENRLSDLSAQLLDVRNEVRALRSDMAAQFRWLIGILVIIFLSLLGTMATGFGWL